MTEHTVEELLAEIADSAAREADFRNRAEVAEAKLAQAWIEGHDAGWENRDLVRTGQLVKVDVTNPYEKQR